MIITYQLNQRPPIWVKYMNECGTLVRFCDFNFNRLKIRTCPFQHFLIGYLNFPFIVTTFSVYQQLPILHRLRPNTTRWHQHQPLCSRSITTLPMPMFFCYHLLCIYLSLCISLLVSLVFDCGWDIEGQLFRVKDIYCKIYVVIWS